MPYLVIVLRVPVQTPLVVLVLRHLLHRLLLLLRRQVLWSGVWLVSRVRVLVLFGNGRSPLGVVDA